MLLRRGGAAVASHASSMSLAAPSITRSMCVTGIPLPSAFDAVPSQATSPPSSLFPHASATAGSRWWRRQAAPAHAAPGSTTSTTMAALTRGFSSSGGGTMYAGSSGDAEGAGSGGGPPRGFDPDDLLAPLRGREFCAPTGGEDRRLTFAFTTLPATTGYLSAESVFTSQPP
jgi:hypothetical protein